MSRSLVLRVTLDGTFIGQAEIAEDGPFMRELPIPAQLTPGRHSIEISANTYVVYHRFLRNGDYRPLAWQLAGPDAVGFGLRSAAIPSPSPA
jgi:hypothetical protein